MSKLYPIRDAVPSDAPFLAKCILAGMHMYDFEEYQSDNMRDILAGLTKCEVREDTLYTFRNTRVAEVGGEPAGALLSYPGEEYLVLRERTFREYWPAFFEQFTSDDPETDPGEWYLDSLAVHPEGAPSGRHPERTREWILQGCAGGRPGVSPSCQDV